MNVTVTTACPALQALMSGQTEVFEKASTEEQKLAFHQYFSLDLSQREKMESAIKAVWENYPDQFIVDRFAADQPALAQYLFEKCTDFYQNMILTVELAEDRYLDLFWEKANQKLKTEGLMGIPWLHTAMVHSAKNFLLYLLNRGENVKIVDSLGITPLDFAKDKKEKIGPFLYNRLRELDGEFTKDMQECKLFGLRHSFEGNRLFNGVNYQHISLVYNSLLCSLGLFKDEWEEPFVWSLDKQYVLDKSKTCGSVIMSGYLGHATACLIFNQMLAKVDTATEESHAAGITFYQIKNEANRQKVAETLLDHRAANAAEGRTYFDETMDRELALERCGFLSFRQSAENCAWTSVKASVLGILILRELQNTPLTQKNIEGAKARVIEEFKKWDDFDRARNIKETYPILSKYPQLFDIPALYSHVIEDCLKARLPGETIMTILQLVPALKNWQNPANGKSLLQEARAKKLDSLSVALNSLAQ